MMDISAFSDNRIPHLGIHHRLEFRLLLGNPFVMQYYMKTPLVNFSGG